MRHYFKKQLVLVSVFLLLAGNSMTVYAHAGKVLFTSGVVKAIDENGKARQLKRGVKIWPGDTIVTGTKGRIQLRTGDGSTVSLQANSEFVIQAHLHVGEEEKQNSVIELLNGGMRAVTGAIGKKYPENFKVKAGNITIGIRGTEIVVQLCKDDCQVEVTKDMKKDDGQQQMQQAKNGVYVGVLNGAITVGRNDSEEKPVELNASLKVVLGEIMGVDENKKQYVFIGETANAQPEPLSEPPQVLLQALSPPSPDEVDVAEIKPASGLNRYEGISVAQMQLYLASLTPKESRRLVMTKFDVLTAQSGIDPLVKHRNLVTPYYGRDASGLYDLTAGMRNYIGP